ncbi:MAG: alpha/beta hydrolase [Candidatus Dormibacteraeota bacterium]|nr:alpha/beta hydrolase [Candidatus Dormibacteraeota bacterium]
MRRRTLLAGAAALLAGGTAYELDRRHLLQERDADPDWQELTIPLQGRPTEVFSADGTRLHVEVFGADDAPTILLIHGWLESIDLWHHQISELSRDFRVVAYELRGHGRSGQPRNGRYDYEVLADDMQAVLDAMLPPGEVCLAAGHSLGGMTIVSWAGRHPESVHVRLAGVALLNTGMSDFVRYATALGNRTGYHVHHAAYQALFFTPVAWPRQFDRVSYFLTKRMALGPSASIGAVAACHRMFTRTHHPARSGFGRMFLTLDLMPAVAKLTAPAAVIGGRLDRLLPPWYSERLASALPDLVEYVDLAESGHMSPLEAPDRVTMHIGRLARACLLVRPVTLEGRAFASAGIEDPPSGEEAAAAGDGAATGAVAVDGAPVIAAGDAEEKPVSKRPRLRRRRRGSPPVNTEVEQNPASR